MTLKIIGAGFGRTGTYSLKTALEKLGFGPCHHMSEVVSNPVQIDLWSQAAAGQADYDAIFNGFQSAVDFPVSAFWREVLAVNPDAKIILSHRDAEDWYESFSQTILPLIMERNSWPVPARPWFEMMEKVIIGKALSGRTDRDGILMAYRENERAVMALAETGRALVFRASDGWEPLCEFLGAEIPDGSYPNTNPLADFFAAVKSGTDATAA